MRNGLAAVAVAMAMACGPLVELPGGTSDSGTTSVGSGPTVTTTTGRPTTATTGRPTTTEADTGVIDDGPRSDFMAFDTNPACVDWPWQGCGLAGAGAVVDGITPVGQFTTTLSVFGSDAGCGGICLVSPNILRIFLVPDPLLIPDLEPYNYIDETLVIELDDWGSGGFAGPLGEPVEARLLANRDGMTVPTTAEVVIDNLPSVAELSEPFDGGNAVKVTGSVEANDAGWNIAGTFVAVYCPDVNEYAICE